MHVSIDVDIGVAARLPLNYENIDLIYKLFKKERGIFIHGMRDTPINYDENNDSFDAEILKSLIGLRSHEEFKMKTVKIAELRHDDYTTRLRRKIEFGGSDDDDDCNAKYSNFDLNGLTFDFFYICENINDSYFYNGNSFNTSYSTVNDCTESFLNNIHRGVSHFKELGINESSLCICNYNTYEFR